MNAYCLLECSENASVEEIRASYHRLLLLVHPDKCQKNEGNVNQFMAITAAYKVLSNTESRRAYDALLLQSQLVNVANRNDDSSLLTLANHFELNEDQTLYMRECRCGSYTTISTNQVNDIFDKFNSSEAESFVIGLECDTCSIVVEVLVI